MRSISILVILVAIICTQLHTTLAVAETKKLVAEEKQAHVRLYASARAGRLENFEVRTEKGIRQFPFWINADHPGAYAPRMLYQDINKDGKKELVIILTLGYGTGVLMQEIHVFHTVNTNIGEIYNEVLVDNPMAIVLKNVRTKMTPHTAEVTVGKKKTIIHIDQLGFKEDTFFTDVGLGSVTRYDIVNNELEATVSAQISPAGFIGEIHITYEFKDNMYQRKQIEFKSVK